MVFTINGIDMTPYVAAQGGFQWKRNDVDAPDAGRTLDATMHRGRVAIKVTLSITCRPLTQAESEIVLNAILPEYVTVTYTDPMSGVVTKSMYSNNTPASYMMRKPDGTEWWSGITFPLIER